MWPHPDDQEQDDDEPGWFPRLLSAQHDEAWGWPYGATREEEEPTGEPPIEIGWLKVAAVFVGALIAVSVAINGVSYGFERAIDALGWTRATVAERLQANGIRVACMACVLLAAIALYWLRIRRRTIYGLTELGFAGYAGFKALDQVQADGLVAGITLVSSVYLMVRGLDNFGQGLHRRGIALSFLPVDGSAPGRPAAGSGGGT
jgi:hypothetical protein